MSATSPAPWTVNPSGGAMTIVARDRSVVAIVMGSGSAAPFESSNAALMVAAPDLRDALRNLLADFEAIDVEPFHADEARAALAKAEASR